MISAILRTHIEIYTERLRLSAPLLELARHGRLTPDMILAYQTSLQYLVGYTGPHLERARVRSRELGRTELEAFFSRKIVEEAGHDSWAQNDVSYTMRLFDTCQNAGPKPALLELVEFLSRTIEDDPMRYLAYILFTEYFTVLIGPEWLMLLEKCCGVPRRALTLVERHIELDKQHVAEGLREVDALVPDSQYLPLLEDTLFRSMAYLERFYEQLCESSRPSPTDYAAAC
jgi:hypothetical protein